MLKRTAAWAAAQRRPLLIGLALALALVLTADHPSTPVFAGGVLESNADGVSVSGRLVDPLGEPVHEAEVAAFINDSDEAVAETTSQEDGSFLLDLPPDKLSSVAVEVIRPHFKSLELELDAEEIAQLNAGCSVLVGTVWLFIRF